MSGPRVESGIKKKADKTASIHPETSGYSIERVLEFPKGYSKKPFSVSGFWKSQKETTYTEFKGIKDVIVCEKKSEFYEWLDAVSEKNEEAFVMMPFNEGDEYYVGFIPRFIRHNVQVKPSKETQKPAATSRIEVCNQDEWEAKVTTIKENIHNHDVEKVVLARKVSLLIDRHVSAQEMGDLIDAGDSFRLGFEFPDLTIFSLSPELLFEKNGDVVMSCAIAGTRRRGKSSMSDKTFENDLKNSRKEKMEHQFVVDAVQDSLNEICSKVSKLKSFEVLKQSNVQHLQSSFKGRLNDQRLSSIIESLFPTPAVAGTPKKEGIDKIKELEAEPRGYFSGLFGKINGSHAEFVVNIRSIFVRKNIAELWSGAGIVRDSNPQEEWNELEHKIQHYLDAFDFSSK